ncbi:HERV-H LTR-associating protein 2 isoform X2 [Epinephelus moara]|uniref:HERV-H LTR-associating protein 2 isoform X2 n=1 Tax=Epinephelus moara TaxID=300413 RepID=UPI00214E61CC|nr:HERV-H LTR-associating protein 2 isoform X2 [Epinephelus moara]
MIGINGSVVCFLTLSVLWTPVRDAEVSCVFMESCILPCSFQVGTEAVIHWIQVKAGDPRVHSYFLNQDQLAQQDQRFRGRTSLFKDQISRGNASLQLTGVELQDQSRYKCITSTTRGNKESIINLKVDALVHKVDIQQVENRITCSSEGIYPEPQLTWSTNPPSSVTLQNKTTVHQTEQQLYNINSSLIVSVTDLVYSCTVSTRRNRRRASLRQLPSVSGLGTETTILCTSSNTSQTGLIWRFNHNQIILNQTRPNVSYTVSEEWRQQVKSVSESGSLTLQHLSSDQDGIYTCELSDDEETYVTNTLVMIEEGREFQRQGAERLKALDPVVDRREEGTMRLMEEADLSIREGVLMWRRSERSYRSYCRRGGWSRSCIDSRPCVLLHI